MVNIYFMGLHYPDIQFILTASGFGDTAADIQNMAVLVRWTIYIQHPTCQLWPLRTPNNLFFWLGSRR